jgi:hypothetical protein
MSGFPSYAHRAAGVHQARVLLLFGAPRSTTALAGPHRLMPVLVPACHWCLRTRQMSRAFRLPPSPQNRRYAYRHPAYTIEARSRAGRSVSYSHAPAYQTAYQSVRPGPIKQVLRRTLTALSAAAIRRRTLADTEGSTGPTPLPPLIGSRLAACPRALRCSRPRSGQLRRMRTTGQLVTLLGSAAGRSSNGTTCGRTCRSARSAGQPDLTRISAQALRRARTRE